MNRRLFLASLTLATAAVPSGYAQTPTRTNLKVVNEIPSRRQRHYPANLGGSTAEIFTARESYYEELTRIGSELLTAYYQHKEFPKDGIFSGLESHAQVLAGVEYPMSNVTGASGYDALVQKAKTRMVEELIVAMAKAVYSAASQQSSEKAGQNFSHWLERWNAAKS